MADPQVTTFNGDNTQVALQEQKVINDAYADQLANAEITKLLNKNAPTSSTPSAGSKSQPAYATPAPSGSRSYGTASTQRTIDVLRKIPSKKSLADKMESLFLGTGSNSLSGNLNQYETNVAHTIFAQEKMFAETTSSVVSAVNTSIQSGVNTIVSTLENTSKEIHETLKPVSKAVGGTFSTLNQMLSSPTGIPEFLGRQVGHLIKAVNPEFYDRMNATFKSNKVQNIKNIPGQVVGSIRSIVNMFDAVLSLPAALISDIYNGLQDIMREISSAIDQVEAAVQKFIFGKDGLLDSIVSFEDFGEFLGTIQELAGYAVGISQTFAGATSIANIALQTTSYINQFVSFVNNPLNLAFAYAPPVVSQGLYALRNPQAIFNQLLPPQLSQGFAQISKMTGLGFNGNMGYGLAGVLQGLQGGMVSSILKNYSRQYPILAPLLTLAPGVSTVTYNQSYKPLYTPSPINPAIKITQKGMPINILSAPPIKTK